MVSGTSRRAPFARARPRTSREWLQLGYLAATAAFVFHAIWIALLDPFLVPYVDDWRSMRAVESEPIREWLLAAQNGHRIPMTRVLYALDRGFLDGRLRLPGVAALLCGAATLLLVVAGFRSGSPRARLSPAHLGFLCFCLVWAWSCHDLRMSIQHSAMQAMLLAVAANVCLVGGFAASSRRRRAAFLLMAGASAFGATMSFGWGFASWASLLATSIVGRLPARAVGFLLVGAVLSLALFVAGEKTVPEYFSTVAAASGEDGPPLVAMVEHVTTNTGAPFGDVVVGLEVLAGMAPPEAVGAAEPIPLAEGVSLAAGSLGLIGYVAFALLLLLRPERVDRRSLLAFGLMTSALAGMSIVGIFRFWAAEGPTHIRFVNLAMLFWVGGVAAVTWLRSRDARDPSPRIGDLVVVWVASLAMVPALQSARAYHEGEQWRTTKEGAMLIAGVRADDRFLGADPKDVYAVVEAMRRDRRGFVMDVPRGLIGEHAFDHYALAPPGACTGAITLRSRVKARGGFAARLGGRAWDAETDTVPAYVVILDRKDTIRGLGLFFQSGLDRIGDPVCRSPADCDQARWLGFAPDSRSPARLRPFAVIGSGDSICEVGSGRGRLSK